MNAKPLMFNKIGDLSTHRHIPRDYVVFKDFILNQSDYLRTLGTGNQILTCKSSLALH